MNPNKAVGLGEPEVVGKKSLFQPPQEPKEPKPTAVEKTPRVRVGDRRVRMTLELNMSSLAIIQESQGRYRLKTGHPLPKWKIIGEALDLYEKMQKGEGT